MRALHPGLGFAVILTAAACSAPRAQSSAFDADAVAAEIETALREEIRSFEAKACARVVEYYADQEPLFVVGGTTMARRADLAAACPGITSRIPDGATRPVASEYIYALSPNSGYSVTEFRIRRGPGGALTSQFVTKIWTRVGEAWRIVHVHESVAQPAP
jgi:ketosteroid isomerase-like protein